MSDFLTALAASALGIADGVEPRSRSRFEDAPGAAWGEQTVEIEAPGPAVGAIETPRAQAAVARPASPEIAGETAVPPAAPFAEPPAPEPAPEPATEPTVIRRVRVAEAPPARAPAPQPELTDAPRRSERVTEPEAQPIEPVRVLRASDAAAERDAPPPAVSPPALAAREPPTPIVIVPDRVEPARSEAPPSAPARPDATAAHPAEPPAPVVQVTIGRIEVRALPAPAAPPQPAAKFAPALSLADYLARKTRGGA
jgi:hypothetical protein